MDSLREDHGQDSSPCAGEGVGDIVILGYHGLGCSRRHSGQWWCAAAVVLVEMETETEIVRSTVVDVGGEV